MAPNIMFTAALVLAMLIVAAAFWLRQRRDLRRRLDREQLASALGLDFYADDPFKLQPQLQTFELFKAPLTGRRRTTGRIRNLVRGQVDDTLVYMFDYTYTIQANNSRRRITQTVFFADDKKWFLPPFRLRPETWWHQVLEKLGVRTDVRLDENPEFSDRFVLNSEFQDLIRHTFSPDVQNVLLENPPLHLEGNNFYLLAYKPRKALDGEAARAFWERCCELTRTLQREEKVELIKLAQKVEVRGEK